MYIKRMEPSTAEPGFMLDAVSIAHAQKQIRPFVKRTPLSRSSYLSGLLGTNVFVKYELFQKTGAFKVRGAFNKILSLSSAEKEKGVVAVSGGNHAQAVAYASKVLDVRAVIVMPDSTPAVYVNATRGYGAAVDLQPSISEAFSKIEHYRKDGMTFVHPFDDPFVMAGQGTLGLEILEDQPNTTDVIASIGGGGLASGVSTALKSTKPEIRIWGVETEGADAMAKAWEAGHPVELPAITSIAKTLGAPAVSAATLEFTRKYLESITVVPDSEAVDAMIAILERLKVITEPAASCTLAAALRLRDVFSPEHNLVLIFCGGNTGASDLCGYLSKFKN